MRFAMMAPSLVVVGVVWVAACADGPTSPSLIEPNAAFSVHGGVMDLLVTRRTTASAPGQSLALEKLLVGHDIVHVRNMAGGSVELIRVRKSNGRSARQIADAIEATGAVEHAEVDAWIEPAVIPSDPLYAGQWHHARINSPGAWDLTTGSGSVLVAVCDGGVELTHPDLAANISGPGYNVVDYTDDGGPMPGSTDPSNGRTHGTKVAGMIGAVGNNAEGVTGVAWTVSILSIRVTNDTMGSAQLSKLVECIDYAREQGARVVNESYGVALSSAVNAAGEALMAAGGLLVVSAGNSDAKLQKNLPGILVVGGTDELDAKTSFSNYGAGIDLVAPAIHISTTRPTWRGTYIVGESGTSFAAPIVVGVAALIWSRNPTLQPDEVQNILFQTAEDLGTSGYDQTFGYGRVDALAAVLAADNPPPPPPPVHGKKK